MIVLSSRMLKYCLFFLFWTNVFGGTSEKVLEIIDAKVEKETKIDFASDYESDNSFLGNLKNNIYGSSVMKGIGRINYSASNLTDFDLKTAWIEGKDDFGIGEYIEYDFKDYTLYGLRNIYI